MKSTRMVRLGVALALVAAPLVVGLTPSDAATPKITVSPQGPYVGGQKVTVTYSGFEPSGSIAIGICPKGRKVEGPGDCAPSKTGGSRLVQANASGGGTGTITIIEGPLQNSVAPSETCGSSAADACTIGATNIITATAATPIVIEYKAAAPSASPTDTASSDPSSSPTPSTIGPQQGPNSATVPMALGGLVAFQLGLIFLVRSVRSNPRGRHLGV